MNHFVERGTAVISSLDASMGRFEPYPTLCVKVHGLPKDACVSLWLCKYSGLDSRTVFNFAKGDSDVFLRRMTTLDAEKAFLTAEQNENTLHLGHLTDAHVDLPDDLNSEELAKVWLEQIYLRPNLLKKCMAARCLSFTRLFSA